MFNSKKNQLFGSNEKTSATGNSFLNEGMKESAKVPSGNMALKYSTTGNGFVDQFGKLGSYKEQRHPFDIFSDTSVLWAKSPHITVAFILFIRMITRVVSLFDGTKTHTVQRGAGLRHEGIMRMIWIAINHPDTFWKNIHLFISVGSWKDVITMLSYDLVYNGWHHRVLDWDKFGKLILARLENPNTSELVKKYLPQIKTNSKCNTVESQADNIIAKWLCSLLFSSKESPSSYKKYRKLKTSGTAHQWQQLISQGKHQLVDFDTVHGRALALMVSSKYLANQGLEKKYEQWISSKPVAKFTGYVHELFQKLPQKKYQIDTLNAQFKQLVETAKKNAKTDTSLIVVRDTSGSMVSAAKGCNMRCGDIAKSLALFFSEMLPDGIFANSWIEFSRDAKMHQWEGSTPYEKFVNDRSSYIGNTNFQSVIDLFVRLKLTNVKESEFPTGILCISDGEFDSSSLNTTNVQTALHRLKNAGFSEQYVSNFKIILWNLQSRYYGEDTGEKFETYGNVSNVFYFSGYDASVMAFLTGVEDNKPAPKNAEELFYSAMNQEVMDLIEI